MQSAIGILEITSISRGIYVADQMLKTSDVEIITANSVCPGKYICIVNGSVSAVRESVEVGEEVSGEFLVDSTIIPNVSELVFPAIVGATLPDKIKAIGIIESFSISNMIIAADYILKSANLNPIELRLGTGLGGKSFFIFTGDVSAVEAGIDEGKKCMMKNGFFVNCEIIPSPSESLLESLL